MQSVPIRDNLHEMSKPIFFGKIISLLSVEFAQRMVTVIAVNDGLRAKKSYYPYMSTRITG